MNQIKVELNWRNYPQFNETFLIEDAGTAADLAQKINAKKVKIESSHEGITTNLMSQKAEALGDRLIVTCQ